MNQDGAALPDDSYLAPEVLSKTRPLYWSVRRELWENRSLYIAPLAVAALTVSLFFLAVFAGIWEKALRLDPAQPAAKLAEPYTYAALLIMATTFVVGVFYCVDALHGERRDRSILFWKSLPVSDLTTVLSKATIAIVILPLLTFVITIATQAAMLLASSAILLVSGQSPAPLWTLPWFPMSAMLLVHLVGLHGLWYAPIFAWLLLVSAAVRRAPIIWALLPVIAIQILEKIAFDTSHVGAILGRRMSGGAAGGMFPMPGMPIQTHTGLLQFLTDPGLWIGFAIAGAFLAGAVRLRRNRGPI